MKVLFFCVLILTSGCTKVSFKESKDPGRLPADQTMREYQAELMAKAQSLGHILEFPTNVTDAEQFAMWHLSEGSDIYPTLWLLNLKSFLSREKGSLFFKNLDSKYGVIRSPYAKSEMSPYAWVGMTAVWDGDDHLEQDLFRNGDTDFTSLPKLKKLKSGDPTIAMTGANCAFCHTGSVKNDQQKILIVDGAPATIEMKGFFYDIIGSTYQTMFDKKELAAFYNRLGVKNAQARAHDFVHDLKKELKVEDTLFTEAIKLLIKTPVIGKKINASVTTKAGRLLYEKKDILTKYMMRMLKETYELDEVTLLMQKRMEYLTWFGAPNPDVITTPEGYGRTDAFGRISNATIRKRSYTHLTAPVSLPPMYAMKYKAFYHYNANTNSLVSRNVGQAFGLGAIVTEHFQGDKNKLKSTVNIPNLIELEKLIHKVPVPEYQRFFPDKKISTDQVVKGCNIYLNKCIQCHEAGVERVGPKRILIDHKLVDMERIGTDRQYIKNISKSAEGADFKNAIFGFTDKVKDGFYAEFGVDQKTQADYAQEEVRGKEIFRDTFLGEKRFAEDSALAYANVKPGKAYVARHLAGVWSSAPYLHNGSVLNLYELLLPESLRSSKFIVGRLEYDHVHLGFDSRIKDADCKSQDDPFCFDTSLVGNSNAGHSPAMYGGELKHQDKLALIEFLKVLTPELETSWTSVPVYKILNDRCVGR